MKNRDACIVHFHFLQKPSSAKVRVGEEVGMKGRLIIISDTQKGGGVRLFVSRACDSLPRNYSSHSPKTLYLKSELPSESGAYPRNVMLHSRETHLILICDLST